MKALIGGGLVVLLIVLALHSIEPASSQPAPGYVTQAQLDQARIRARDEATERSDSSWIPPQKPHSNP